jgi:hypothetical protein
MLVLSRELAIASEILTMDGEKMAIYGLLCPCGLAVAWRCSHENRVQVSFVSLVSWATLEIDFGLSLAL